jgi:serine kinase
MTKQAILYNTSIHKSYLQNMSAKKDEQEERQRKEQEFRAQPLPKGIKKRAPDEQNKLFKEVAAILSKKKVEVVDEIGSGNYSTVYYGLNMDQLKHNAIKVIDLKKASDNYRVKFLRKEITVMQRMKHQNIIKIYDLMQTDNKILIVMEYAVYGSLGDWLKANGAFSEKDCQQVFKSIVEGLRYMHSVNFAHRDMKADNVLLTKYFVPKLSDFSHSRQSDLDPKDMTREKLSQTFCGSIPYFRNFGSIKVLFKSDLAIFTFTAPQILQLRGYMPQKYDVWASGVLLFQMFENQFPFDPKDEKQMLDNQLRRHYSYHKTVSDAAKDVISKMLDPNETSRITTTALILHPWVKEAKPMMKTDMTPANADNSPTGGANTTNKKQNQTTDPNPRT